MPKFTWGTAPRTAHPRVSGASVSNSPLTSFCCLVSKNGRGLISQHPLCRAVCISVRIEAVCGFNCPPVLGRISTLGRMRALLQITLLLRSALCVSPGPGATQVRRGTACRRAGVSPPQRGGLRVPRDPSVRVPTQAQPRDQALPKSSHGEQRSAARAELG